MPRKARIDAPGALYHITARGIQRRKMFLDTEEDADILDADKGDETEDKAKGKSWVELKIGEKVEIPPVDPAKAATRFP